MGKVQDHPHPNPLPQGERELKMTSPLVGEVASGAAGEGKRNWGQSPIPFESYYCAAGALGAWSTPFG